MKKRLDQRLAELSLISTRSQAETYIKIGKVRVNNKKIIKSGFMVEDSDDIQLIDTEHYVSRAGLKLASIAKILNLDFFNKIVLDVGSSTGGFTDYSLQHGAKQVIAVDVGTEQLHSSLRHDKRIILYEKTDIRNVVMAIDTKKMKDNNLVYLTEYPDIILIDVSFISLREILPTVSKLCGKQTLLVVMLKPQFEAYISSLKHKGVIKNDRLRRDIIKSFETWSQNYYITINKADSDIAGTHGNRERFYSLKKTI